MKQNHYEDTFFCATSASAILAPAAVDERVLSIWKVRNGGRERKKEGDTERKGFTFWHVQLYHPVVPRGGERRAALLNQQ